jgi:hypothetical protein
VASPEVEVPLHGGRVTVGIVRIGATVRRPWKPSSDRMAKLLGYLEERGCTWVPRHLGRDPQGRDVLSFIDGEVPDHWREFEDAQIAAAAALLRKFHEATRGSPLVEGAAVLVHNDPAPSNFVFQNDVPVALIDFDMLAPGDPLEDVGYMAWSWCVSSKANRLPVSFQARQVRVLVDAYGLEAAHRRDLVSAMLERQERNIRFWTKQQRARATTVASTDQITEIIAWSRREREYTSVNRAAFESALD